MKLLRLKLENFRQHRDTEINFGDGMTAIVGANGTGKTTILEAITFALYGVQRKTRETLKFHWAEPRSKLQVVLEFEFEGARFVLERNATDASLKEVSREPAVTRATGLREVKAACEKLLRLSYEQFKNSFCAEQKGLAFLQFNTDTRRQEQVAKMLGFERLRLAAARANEQGRVFRGIADGFALTMGDLPQLAAAKSMAQEELKAAEKVVAHVRELQAEFKKLLPPAAAKKQLADEYGRLTQKADVFGSTAEALKSARKRAENTMAKATADAATKRDLEPLFLEWTKLDGAVLEMQVLRETEREHERGLAELARLDAELAELDKKMSGFKAIDVEASRKAVLAAAVASKGAAAALKDAEAGWSKSLMATQRALAEAQAHLKEAQRALARAEELVRQGICPECGQPTTGSFEERLIQLQTTVTGCEKSNSQAEKAFASAGGKPSAVSKAESGLQSAQAVHVKAQDGLATAEKLEVEFKTLSREREPKIGRQKSLKGELAKQTPKYDRAAHEQADARLKLLRPKQEAYLRLGGADEVLASATKDLGQAVKDIEAARQEYKRLIAERDKLPFKSSEDVQQAINDFERLRDRVVDASAQEKQAGAQIQICEAKLKQAEERIVTYREAEGALKESRSQALLHETADRQMKILREELNAVIRPELEMRASDNLALLTNGRYPVLELDEEFNATVIEDDGVRKQVISGGEEDVVALALRMALSELIQERQGRPMSLLILDEVFGSLDSDRRQAVLERLQAIKGRFAQILVISHIEEINQVADHCIFLQRDERTRATAVGDLPLEIGQLALV